MSPDANTQQIQSVVKDILNEVVKICNRNGIAYYVIEGTLLGTVRHKGFIPWDDDIDIAISVTELDRFVQCCREQLPTPLYIDAAFARERTTKYYPDLTRVCNSQYRIVDTSGHTMDLWIDVFIMVGLPEGRIARRLYYCSLMLRKPMPKVCRPEIIGEKYWKNRSLLRRSVIAFVKRVKIGKFLSYERQIDKLKEILERYAPENSNKVMVYPSAYGTKEIVPRAFYGMGVYGEFERIKVRMPSKYDELLTKLYGDYMQIPPEDKRVPSHVDIIVSMTDDGANGEKTF